MTDAATVEVVEMVLAGTINKQIVNQINQLGGHACGISGKDGNLMVALKLTKTERDPETNTERVLDLGFVGEPEEVNPGIVQVLAANEFIPVVAPAGLRARRHDLQHQRRYLRERAGSLAQGQAAIVAD